jgi:mannose-6-phosphate isomerase-like protein (cupin superfamily)
VATEFETAGAPKVHPGTLYRAEPGGASFVQRFLHGEAHLEFLDAGEYRLPGGTRTREASLPTRESLLFQWRGESTVRVDGAAYELAHYDSLYVPRAAALSIENPHAEPAVLIETSAPAEQRHPAFHSRFAEFSQREERIRHLPGGRTVYQMFDVSEAADKLVAGYTFFEPYARSWPPHNHTDQEESYIFLDGTGAMEVYESPETLSFVHSVKEGDAVTIPYLNYHPVFAQDTPLVFLWCIAGARYWIGDKNKEFLAGSSSPITT